MKKVVMTVAAFLNLALLSQAQSLVKPISQKINTKEYREHALSVSGDGKVCVFAQERQDGTHLMMSTRNDVNVDWNSPVEVSNLAKSKVSTTTLNYDGTLLFFDAELASSFGEKDIYFAERIGDKWSHMQNAGEPLNTSMHEGNPSISPDGKTLFFVREKYEKIGDKSCYTIWVSNRTEDGGWTNFDKLPDPVNSDCEKAPIIMADNRTMIFSSLRPGGKGGFDFYQTELQEDGSWTFPKDLDFLNSDKDEEFLAVSGNSEKAYFEIKGDIYEIILPAKFRGTKSVPISFKIVDALTKEPIDAKLTTALNSKSKLSMDSKNGQSDFQLKAGTDYTVALAANGYGSKEVKISLVETPDGSVENVVELMPMRMTYKFNFISSSGSTVFDAKYKMIDLKTNQPISVDANGAVNLVFGGNYAISVIATGFEPFAEQFTADTKDAANSFNKTITLTGKNEVIVKTGTTKKIVETKVPIEEVVYNEAKAPDAKKPVETYKLKSDPTIVYETKKIYTFNDVYFKTSSPIIASEYFIDLNRLTELMTLNPNLSVQLAGYSDTSGDAAFNVKLSERRAKACADYLYRSGIDKSRILVQGFGEQEIIYDPNGREDKFKSRRVRFIVY
jgi:outer membrane protein OmpA-like peptidoglycan-associated protein